VSPNNERPTAPNRLDAKTLERVRALLAKAESTSFVEEAEAFTVKAQELMARYGIDAAMMAVATERASSPGRRNVALDPPYEEAKALLLTVVAQANRCEAVWSKHENQSVVFGFDVDLDVVELLYVSLHLQATTAMLAAGSHVDPGGRSRTRSFRRAFLMSFASRIGERLREAAEAVLVEAEADIGRALVPVLAERVEAVHAAVSQAFPSLHAKAPTISNHGGWHAGRAAADRANLHNRDAIVP
jgi:hypothetical protein